jgi:uncharacterized protein (UPF0333 family)
MMLLMIIVSLLLLLTNANSNVYIFFLLSLLFILLLLPLSLSSFFSAKFNSSTRFKSTRDASKAAVQITWWAPSAPDAQGSGKSLGSPNGVHGY